MKNRKLKFRVWNRKKEEMLKPFHLLQYMDASERYQQEMCDAYGEDVVLMQYTGLKDKNGVELYEKDIIEITTPLEFKFRPPYYNVPVKGGKVRKSVTIVESLEEAFDPENGLAYLLGNGEISTWRVIGNIFEDPNLLEKKDE